MRRKLRGGGGTGDVAQAELKLQKAIFFKKRISANSELTKKKLEKDSLAEGGVEAEGCVEEGLEHIKLTRT